MKSEEDGRWNLFVYDALLGMWHREDYTRVDAFCSCRNEMYFIEHGTGKIRTMHGSGTIDLTDVEWCAETGMLGLSMPDRKFISRLLFRMQLSPGRTVRIYLEYDSSGTWEEAASVTGTTLRTFTIPVRPKRCDHFRIKITGSGDAKIFSITKQIEQGSDLH